jgi:hypothetical protein
MLNTIRRRGKQDKVEELIEEGSYEGIESRKQQEEEQETPRQRRGR